MLTGSADTHAEAHDVGNLTLGFGDAAFTGGDGGHVFWSTSPEITIDTPLTVPGDSALLTSALRAGDTFRLLFVSSTIRDATANTGMSATGGEPICWLDGAKVADDYAAFWDDSWESLAGKNESGSDSTPSQGRTECDSDGPRAGWGYRRTFRRQGRTACVLPQVLQPELG